MKQTNSWSALVPIVGALCMLGAPAARAEVDKKSEKLWKAKCASCHGVDGKGKTEQGLKVDLPDISVPGWQTKNADAQIRQKITEGSIKEKGAVKLEMDPYKDKLQPEQVDGLIAFIRTLAG